MGLDIGSRDFGHFIGRSITVLSRSNRAVVGDFHWHVDCCDWHDGVGPFVWSQNIEVQEMVGTANHGIVVHIVWRHHHIQAVGGGIVDYPFHRDAVSFLRKLFNSQRLSKGGNTHSNANINSVENQCISQRYVKRNEKRFVVYN